MFPAQCRRRINSRCSNANTLPRCKRWWRSIRLRKRCGSDSGRGTTVAASTAGGTDGAISLWTASALPALLEARRGVLDTELAVNQAEREMARTWAAVNWLIPQELAQ